MARPFERLFLERAHQLQAVAMLDRDNKKENANESVGLANAFLASICAPSKGYSVFDFFTQFQ